MDIHMTSPRKGWFTGDDGNKKFFTLINGKPICDDLIDGCIYHDRLWSAHKGKTQSTENNPS